VAIRSHGTKFPIRQANRRSPRLSEISKAVGSSCTREPCQRMDDAHSVVYLLRPRTVPVISIPLTLRRATASAVHPADLPQ
jgi:hypothetical protein